MDNDNIYEIVKALPDNRWKPGQTPSSESKKAGHLRKKRNRELAQAILDLDFKGADPEFRQKAADYFGVEPEHVHVEMMMVFMQVFKAIQKADTAAFEALMNRAYGKPKETHEFLNGAQAPPAIYFDTLPPPTDDQPDLEILESELPTNDSNRDTHSEEPVS